MRVDNSMSDESLLRELEDLKQADWASIWEGPPTAVDPGFEEWCSRRGWKPLTVERDLDVTTRSGNKATLSSKGFWSPVVSLDFFDSLQKTSTSEPEEKKEAVQKGVDGWKHYTRLTSGVWGAPTWSGAAGDSDFPEPPVDDPLWKPESSKGNPFRLSFWTPQGSEGPVVVLTLGVTRFTWKPGTGAATNLSISFFPPVKGTGRG